jgi:O-antigen/teichoic acid export membrane protein
VAGSAVCWTVSPAQPAKAARRSLVSFEAGRKAILPSAADNGLRWTEMSLRKYALRGSLTLTLGGFVANGSSFVRNMILARVLTKSDFGIAAALGLVITLFEFSAKLGMTRFVVQDKEGNEQGFVSVAHLVQFSVAGASALLIAAAAPLLAHLFGIPGQARFIAALALVAVLRGLQHVDVRRYERDLRFTPSTLVETVPQVMIALGAWPVAVWLRDFRAVLVLLISKEALGCFASHLLAERPYRWQWHRNYVLRMLRFGWPMLVTGFLMFGVLQGDQFFVASFYAMSDLGPYAAAAALTMAPTFFFGRAFNSVAFPILARVQDDPVALQRRYRQVLAAVIAFSATSTVGIVIGAEAVMRIVYGPKYAGAGIILGWLAAANAFRNLRMAPSLAALARGDSQNQMISNACRLVALLPALALALAQRPVWTLACCGLLGEALACWASLLRLRHRDGVPLSTTLVPAKWLAVLVGGAGLATLWGVHGFPIFLALASAAAGALVAGAVLIGALPELRKEAISAWNGFRVGGWREAVSRMSGHSLVRKELAL